MLVADAFDAITSTRPYREALSAEHACEELMRHAGSQFDPACVQALLSHLAAPNVSTGDVLVREGPRALSEARAERVS
jgi:HD-GYP domain-containing protein (c-di-GMP phosphodiesterase class II)